MDKPPPRPLLPAPPPSESRAGLKTPPTGTPLPPRRSASIAACELCREKKAKCDSRRPTCGRCLSNGVQCTYTTKVNETLTQADKREKARYKKERDDLLHLLTSIRDKPQREAENIFARLRVFNDPFEVCQSLRDAELLPFVSSSPAKLPSPSDANEIIDIHVPARPWTTLVNDAVVSRLMSRFFSPSSQLFPAIDRDVFVSDMQAKNLTTSKLCSPLLANAVCAMPCFELTSSTGLVELFLSQAKSILEREHGRPSLPTVLALYLLYLISALLGRDRAGLHFRRTSLDMLEYLDLESRIKYLRDDVPDQALERRVLSKALWGIFVAESRTFLLYNRPPLVRPPMVPRLFELDTPIQTSLCADNARNAAMADADGDVNGRLTDALCSLAEIQYTIAMHEAEQNTGVGSGEDIRIRQSILLRWRVLCDLFSNQLQAETNSSLSSCYVSLQQSEVALSVLHPLPAELTLPDESTVTTTVKDLFIQHARFISETVDALLQWSHNRPHYPIGFALYYSLVPLIPLLDPEDTGSDTHELFINGCVRLSVCAQIYPFFGRLLQAIGALAWRLGKDVPLKARECFQHIKVSTPRHDVEDGEVHDIPLAMDIPRLWAMRHLQTNNHVGDDKNGYLPVGQLGKMMEHWSGANRLDGG